MISESILKAVADRIRKYCAYQERCHSEVREKLRTLEVYGDDAEELIVELIQENYLNEERFAKAFARGRHSIKRWGKGKIREALKRKQIGERLIDEALEDIDPEDYIIALRHLGRRKAAASSFAKLTEFEQKETIRKYLFSRGYEWDLINDQLKNHPEEFVAD